MAVEHGIGDRNRGDLVVAIERRIDSGIDGIDVNADAGPGHQRHIGVGIGAAGEQDQKVVGISLADEFVVLLRTHDKPEDQLGHAGIGAEAVGQPGNIEFRTGADAGPRPSPEGAGCTGHLGHVPGPQDGAA